MLLAKYLRPEVILVSPDISDKGKLLRYMVEVAKRGPFGGTLAHLSIKQIFETVALREEAGATCIGSGVAVPHTRIPEMSNVLLCLALIPDGIDFDAPDHKPVNIVCLLLTPEEKPELALKMYATLSSFLYNNGTRQDLLNCKTPEEAYRLICDKNPTESVSLTAKSIMREPRVHVTRDMSLREVTHLMLLHRVEAVPVLDAEDHVVGEISCKQLYHLGIPDFFRQLQTVSFVRHFDPFEDYFKQERHAKAADVMSDHFCILPEDSTLLEIIFALSVQEYPKVYVTDNNKLTGIIDHTTVLDRILNW